MPYSECIQKEDHSTGREELKSRTNGDDMVNSDHVIAVGKASSFAGFSLELVNPELRSS